MTVGEQILASVAERLIDNGYTECYDWKCCENNRELEGNELFGPGEVNTILAWYRGYLAGLNENLQSKEVQYD